MLDPIFIQSLISHALGLCRRFFSESVVGKTSWLIAPFLIILVFVLAPLCVLVPQFCAMCNSSPGTPYEATGLPPFELR
jgi:hypothetical protein